MAKSHTLLENEVRIREAMLWVAHSFSVRVQLTFLDSRYLAF